LITFLDSAAQVSDGWGGEVFRFAQRRAHRGGVHRLLFVQVEIYSVIPGEQLECIGTLKISNPHVVQLQLSSIPWQIC
jgi:hypothetical protein